MIHRKPLQLVDGGMIVDAVADLATYTENDARQIAIAILSALRHAHEDGLCVHRGTPIPPSRRSASPFLAGTLFVADVNKFRTNGNRWGHHMLAF